MTSVFILLLSAFFFFYNFRGTFRVIFDSQVFLDLFANFFSDLLILGVADLWLKFH